jgi:hypothetical protein
MNSKKKPAHTVRSGRIRAFVWEHETPAGPKYRVRLSRLRKSRNGTKSWVAATVFGTLDILDAREVLDSAFAWIGPKFFEHEHEAGRPLKLL